MVAGGGGGGDEAKGARFVGEAARERGTGEGRAAKKQFITALPLRPPLPSHSFPRDEGKREEQTKREKNATATEEIDNVNMVYCQFYFGG